MSVFRILLALKRNIKFSSSRNSIYRKQYVRVEFGMAFLYKKSCQTHKIATFFAPIQPEKGKKEVKGPISLPLFLSQTPSPFLQPFPSPHGITLSPPPPPFPSCVGGGGGGGGCGGSGGGCGCGGCGCGGGGCGGGGGGPNNRKVANMPYYKGREGCLRWRLTQKSHASRK